MSIHYAIRCAEALLPGEPAPDKEPDPRWHAIIEVAYFIESEPEEVWAFTARWGCHEQEDLRMAIALCVLEHLLQYHFALIFPRVVRLARRDPLFAETFTWCRKFGQAEERRNSVRFERLMRELRPAD